MYDMPTNPDIDYDEWIWVPPGFAHGNIFTEESRIEYFCTGEYSQGCETGISSLAGDIDWSLCETDLKNLTSLSRTLCLPCGSSSAIITANKSHRVPWDYIEEKVNSYIINCTK